MAAYKKAGSAVESGDKDKRGGVYLHPETGNRLIAVTHPKFGTTQADAYIRAGFQFERDATPAEILGNEPLKKAKVVVREVEVDGETETVLKEKTDKITDLESKLREAEENLKKVEAEAKEKEEEAQKELARKQQAEAEAKAKAEADAKAAAAKAQSQAQSNQSK